MKTEDTFFFSVPFLVHDLFAKHENCACAANLKYRQIYFMLAFANENTNYFWLFFCISRATW